MHCCPVGLRTAEGGERAAVPPQPSATGVMRLSQRCGEELERVRGVGGLRTPERSVRSRASAGRRGVGG
ncbi:unnamed protein product [Gadus morhua 'NCC']